MRLIKTFEQFTNEEAINAGPESDVVIKDITTHNGTEISSEELLGMIVSSDNEEQVVDKAYDKFGQASFSEEDMSKVRQYYNDYSAEQKEKEVEAEADAEDAAADGGEEDPLADLDV